MVIRYFAYGSNMLTYRLLARTPSARALGPAQSVGWDLRFHKRGQDGSAKCGIVETGSGGTVHGVLFEIAAAELPALDAAEGPGYRRETIRVAGLACETYIAVETTDDPRPFGWYLRLVLAGLMEHRAPAEYLAHMRDVP